MKKLKQIKDTPTIYEVTVKLYDQVIKGGINSFSELVTKAKAFPESRLKTRALYKCFSLIKRLYWGFFKDLNPKRYGKIWNELVIPHKKYSFGGDLKQQMTISNLYIGIIDIHGYTDFCEKAGMNLSMLELLDNSIHQDISNLAAKKNILTQRARGDEIVLVGTDSIDIIETTINISAYFSKENSYLTDETMNDHPDRHITLPKMAISAGIAGGMKYTPLLITSDGDISGSVVNMAARLQGRANKFSGKQNRILITKTVCSNFYQAAKLRKTKLKDDSFAVFFNAGSIAFKGVQLSVCEVIVNEEQKYRKNYEENLKKLISSIKRGLWEKQILLDLSALIKRACKSMKQFSITPDETFDKNEITNDTIIEQISYMEYFLRKTCDYSSAFLHLENVLEMMETVPNFDGLVLSYTREIHSQYAQVLVRFEAAVDYLLDEKAEDLFNLKNRNLYRIAKKHNELYKKMRKKARESKDLKEQRQLWRRLIKEYQQDMEVKIHSKK